MGFFWVELLACVSAMNEHTVSTIPKLTMSKPTSLPSYMPKPYITNGGIAVASMAIAKNLILTVSTIFISSIPPSNERYDRTAFMRNAVASASGEPFLNPKRPMKLRQALSGQGTDAPTDGFAVESGLPLDRCERYAHFTVRRCELVQSLQAFGLIRTHLQPLFSVLTEDTAEMSVMPTAAFQPKSQEIRIIPPTIAIRQQMKIKASLLSPIN